MRKIDAIIRKSKFKEVKRGLIAEGFNSFNYQLTRCISEKSEKRFYRGVEYDAKASDRVSLSLYVNYTDLSRALSIITENGNTGHKIIPIFTICRGSDSVLTRMQHIRST